MGRRRKLNMGHRGSEGTQSVPSERNSTDAQGSNTEGYKHESADSHSIPSDIEAEEAQVEKDPEPKRLRGPTRMLDVWDMEDEFIIVKLDKHGRFVGEEGTTLTRFIGTMARRPQYAPINYESWKDMLLRSC